MARVREELLRRLEARPMLKVWERERKARD